MRLGSLDGCEGRESCRDRCYISCRNVGDDAMDAVASEVIGKGQDNSHPYSAWVSHGSESRTAGHRGDGSIDKSRGKPSLLK